MTKKEFEKLTQSITSERFIGDISDPLEYGIQRGAFEKHKFTRLIAAAKQVKLNGKTVRSKLELWNRMLARTEQSQTRLEKLRKEIQASRPAFLSARRRALAADANEK
jgi:hypothetical protein